LRIASEVLLLTVIEGGRLKNDELNLFMKFGVKAPENPEAHVNEAIPDLNLSS